jgi:hypothetical protein
MTMGERVDAGGGEVGVARGGVHRGTV